MSTQMHISMAMSYSVMCKYYELCVPGIESKNPHFLSSLHVIKKESSPAIETVAVNNLPSVSQQSSSVQQENKVTSSTGGSQLKLLFKGKKDNKIHVKCSCNDITDGSAIKRKFLIKCNKCQAMVHGKCHNLNAQLFNSNNNHSSKWFCSMCTIDIQSEIRKNAMVEDIKRAVQTSPKPQSPSVSQPKKSKNSRKKDNKNKSGPSMNTNSRPKHKGLKSNDKEKCENKTKRDKSKSNKDSKQGSLKRPNNVQRSSSCEKSASCKRPRYVPIQPKQS